MTGVNPYLYPEHPLSFNLQLVKQNKHWRHYSVEFPVASPNHYEGGEIAKGEYFEPLQVKNAPLAILIHGWGDHSVIPFKLMAGGLLRRGVACFILYLPFHDSRLPEEMKPRLSRLTPEEWFTGYQMAVTDIKQIVDWANETGHQKVTVISLSLGSFASSIAMGIDRRITAGVFIVHGGNSGKIMQLSRISNFRKSYRRSQEEYQENQKKYSEYMREVASKGFENVTPEQQNFLIDPLTYAHLLRGRSVLMINALWDEIIPREASLEFRQACGQGEQIWFPATHASIWLWYPFIVRKINNFLKASLNL